jgi:hypothetical protein
MEKKYVGRSSDLSFSWLVTDHGHSWSHWQQYATEWLIEEYKSTHHKIRALSLFFETYINQHAPYAINVNHFFLGYRGHHCSTDEFLKILKASGIKSRPYLADIVRTIYNFINWVIKHHFPTTVDNSTSSMAVNPFLKVNIKHYENETVHNPLPYRYIQELRQILCPLPSKEELARFELGSKTDETTLPPYRYRHFKDWVWAQQQIGCGKRGSGGDWFEVAQKLIDKSDPDCVWRSKKINRNNEIITVYQIWSPVRAMLVYIKLHLPLRTYQARFLDSGEADTWRYEQGQWIENTAHDFAFGTKKRQFSRGVFKRIYDSFLGMYSTGLFISTNKTSDLNKDEVDRGYCIPWQHEEILYWIEKLRNWQEKYNPISAPTPCTTLKKKHFGQVKSKRSKIEIGSFCFLFRHAAAKGADRHKPIPGDQMVSTFWYHLLRTFQYKLLDEGITLDDGSHLKLVKDYPEGIKKHHMISTLFPLHSLRVSLITAYTMDTELPLPVISKLLAGHTRLFTTIYYNKIPPSVFTDKMNEVEQTLNEKAKQSVRTFLKDANQQQIQCKMAYHDENSVVAALANRNPIGWESRAQGLCLVGGNTVMSDENSNLGGCWNGGKLIQNAKGGHLRRYTPVPHGPENCVRCRWFITDASYLPPLNAHFNQLSYMAHQAADLSNQLEHDLEALKDQIFFAEAQDLPFTKQEQLQVIQRRFEKQQVEADEYTKDMIATFNLIHRILHLEETRSENDNSDKLVLLGSSEEISNSLKFTETDSELLHLSLICEDAEFYPDLGDTLLKTPAIHKRSSQLNRILMHKGYAPIFMEMDDKMQLIAANAMMRNMAKIADPDDKLEGYRKIVGYLETKAYMQDHKLLDAGFSALEKVVPISLTLLTDQTTKDVKWNSA